MNKIERIGWGAEGMAGSVVNLDAMIPREDMLSPAAEFRGATTERIDITHLDDGFFSSMLRKPDFQRETAHWSPDKVAELVKAFVTGDLIPAVILWRRGANVFVIDGAHRLSALIAWVRDDYGAGKWSLDHFGGAVPAEQRKMAERTKKLVNDLVGPYAQLAGAKRFPQNASPEVQAMLGNLAANAIVAQWVPQVDEKAAEESFFKINQAATPIDPTERQILRSRATANAIAARAIVHGGTGHKYWSSFPTTTQHEIEAKAKAMYSALYEPPLGSSIKTLDLPVAGRGYSALPFVYELVNWANDVPDYSKSKIGMPPDSNGVETIAFLNKVENAVGLVTGNQSKSLGLHPVVYFYTRGGEFQPVAFIATAAFVRQLAERNKLPAFSKVRNAFEQFLLEHKEFTSLIVKRTGSGRRSLGRITRYLDTVFEGFVAGKNSDEVLDTLNKDPEFLFLVASMKTPSDRDGENKSRRFNKSTRSASFIETAIQGAVRCGVCHSLVHVNSMSVDHIIEARSGGGTDTSNAQITHPYCNSAKDILKCA